jgi:hypothetical protein
MGAGCNPQNKPSNMKLETKLKHTPAPWQLSTTEEWNYNRHGCLMVGGGDDGSDIVAQIRTNCSDVCTDSESANARLIAAAPDMLDALMQATILLKHACDGHALESQYALETADAMTAAITKAIGELRYDTLDYDTK